VLDAFFLWIWRGWKAYDRLIMTMNVMKLYGPKVLSGTRRTAAVNCVFYDNCGRVCVSLRTVWLVSIFDVEDSGDFCLMSASLTGRRRRACVE